MVEKTPARAFWPSFYEPFRHCGARLSEWLAPASEASSDDNNFTRCNSHNFCIFYGKRGFPGFRLSNLGS